ncbi:MAG: hypothetical protein ACREPB_12505 [Arenimonas sp.]
MNRYFSRLAERSGMHANAAAARPGNASPHAASDWSEQSFETVTTGDSSLSIQGKNAVEKNNETHGIENSRIANIAKNSLEQTDTSVQSSIPASNPDYPDSRLHRIDKGMTSVSAELSNTFETQSNFPQAFIADEIGKIATDASEKKFFSDQEATTSENLSSTTSEHFTYSKKDLTGSRSSSNSAIKDAQATRAFSSASADLLEPSVPIKSLPSTSNIADGSNEDSIVESRSTARSEATPSQHSAVTSRKADYITSSPAQINALAVQQARTMPNSSIEVNIGKIELEIFTPARKSAPVPASVPNSIPQAKPAAVFNPHRHYLRGR